MKILIVEDEESIALPLKKALEHRGFAVDYAQDGKEALVQTAVNEYDCILLDLNLPEVDGMEVSRKLRADKNNVPIIMLTARSQIVDKLDGFEFGADDYITKPFNLEELIARINAVIKRSSPNKVQQLTAGNCTLNPDTNTAAITDKKGKIKEVTLSNKETAIFEYLIRNSGRIVSSEEILEHVWDETVDLFSDTVKTHIKTLRKKVDPRKKIIKTIRGKGYLIE